MSRINTNVGAMLSQRVLGQNNKTLSNSLQRLSTGYRINRGADDPAGLIASENLRSEKAAIGAAIGNAERADQVMNIAEGGLQEVNNLLVELQSLVGQSANDAGLSTEEKEANQLQIDSIIQTIDRIADSTSFQGTKLLNGTFDYQVDSVDAGVEDYQVNGAKLGHGDTRDVQVLVTQSAQHGALFMSMGGTLDMSGQGESLTFEVAGSKGSRQFTFASGTSMDDVVEAINTYSDVTGVVASAGTVTSSTGGVVLRSTEFGGNEFVSVDIINDANVDGGVYTMSATDETTVATASGVDFAAATNAIRDDGQDIGATINGISASTNGKTARINTDFLDVEITLADTESQTLDSVDAFTIQGGGANFNLGPNVEINNQVSIGIGNVAARKLGSSVSGFLSDLGAGKANNVVDGDLAAAQDIVNASIKQVTSLRGRLGAFQKNVVGSTIRSLGVAMENTSAAESAIRDTDFAKETAELTRAQILVQASTQTLALAKSQPQSVLGLLG